MRSRLVAIEGPPEGPLGHREGLPHLEDRGSEFCTWLLPRIAFRETRDGRDYFGLCRVHEWLDGPVVYVQDVSKCPVCHPAEGDDVSLHRGRTRYAAAQAAGVL